MGSSRISTGSRFHNFADGGPCAVEVGGCCTCADVAVRPNLNLNSCLRPPSKVARYSSRFAQADPSYCP